MYISMEYAIIFIAIGAISRIVGFMGFVSNPATSDPNTLPFFAYVGAIGYTIFNYGFLYGLVTFFELGLGVIIGNIVIAIYISFRG